MSRECVGTNGWRTIKRTVQMSVSECRSLSKEVITGRRDHRCWLEYPLIPGTLGALQTLVPTPQTSHHDGHKQTTCVLLLWTAGQLVVAGWHTHTPLLGCTLGSLEKMAWGVVVLHCKPSHLSQVPLFQACGSTAGLQHPYPPPRGDLQQSAAPLCEAGERLHSTIGCTTGKQHDMLCKEEA